MILVYILIPLIASIPLLVTLKRIRKYKNMERYGVQRKAEITHMEIVPFFRGRGLNRIYLNYIESGKLISETVVTDKNYKIGEVLTISHEKNNSKIYIKGAEKGYYPSLVFAIILLVFMCFATFMIHDMVVNGGY